MPRKAFHHPFEPYDIQQDFMERLYDCIERGGVGIFESPTGTGKSLSLICGALTWLREHKRKRFDEAVATVEVDDDEPTWMIEHARDSRRRELAQARIDLEKRLQLVREKENRTREKDKFQQPLNKRQKQMGDDTRTGNDTEEDQFVLDEYESDNETTAAHTTYSTETTALMKQLGLAFSSRDQEDGIEYTDELKVIFCSRTHSQLSQFVGELRRVRLPASMPDDCSEIDGASQEAVKQLSLGSRKNLCINPRVNKLADQTAINERCIDLQQAKTSTDRKCPFLPKKNQESAFLDFRDHALSRIRDIEDLANLGHRLDICPYYASRAAINPAEVVALPYPLLLQKSARDALGLSLKGHVVIIDEAHNLLDAIEGIYSSQVTATQLQRAKDSLMAYLQKFRNRLKGRNRVYVTQVVRVLDSLLSFLTDLQADRAGGGVVDPSKLLLGKGVDQVNLSKLVRYISESKLARKVEGYITFAAGKEVSTGHEQNPRTPNLTLVQNFITSLMNPSKEGKFFWSREDTSLVLRYMLLDPSEHFRSIVEDARAVILAGGTMSPMGDYQQQLFPYLSDTATFSCGHLIPKQNLLVRSIVADGDGPFNFNFTTRKQQSTAARIGRALLAIAPHVEGGMIVFFPSYSFLESVVAGLRSRSPSILPSLETCKPLFFDSRRGSGESSSSEATFHAYSSAVVSDNKRGAMLFSVLGGKLSEGINFSDALGRCVMVVGLPFPNVETPEWKAKMAYIDEKFERPVAMQGHAGPRPSQAHIENVCMRSVNQAIGRVIRHKNDWASILLMDTRYAEPRIRNKLPAWILKSCDGEKDKLSPSGFSSVSSSLDVVKEDVARFFTQRRSLNF